MVYTQMSGNPAQAHPIHVQFQGFLAGLFIVSPCFGLGRIFALEVHTAIPLTSPACLSGSVLPVGAVTFWTAIHVPILAHFLATPGRFVRYIDSLKIYKVWDQT